MKTRETSSAGSQFVGTTTIHGQTFSPVPLAALSQTDGTFVTGTDVQQHTASSLDQRPLASSPSPVPPQSLFPHIRPMSPFERAGINLQRSSTPTFPSSAIMRPSRLAAQSPGGAHLPPRPSSSLSGAAPIAVVLSAAEDEKFQPSLDWYESHYFYSRDKPGGASGAGTTKSKRGSSTSGSFSLADGSGSGIFQLLGARKISTYTGDFAAAMQEIRQAYDSKTLKSAMGPFCSNLIYKVDERGMIMFFDVVSCVLDLVPPPQAEEVADACRSFLVDIGGMRTVQQSSSGIHHVSATTTPLPTSLLSAPWLSWKLPFPRLYEAVDAMFLGSQEKVVVKKCFEMCDVTGCGYILKDMFRLFRDEERLLALASSGTSAALLPAPQLTYIVAKGVWRIFERVALAEEEKVRSGGGKGKKGKSKKGANGPVVVPGKRQFHINFDEFNTAIKEDGYILLAFLPFAIEVWVKERLVV